MGTPTLAPNSTWFTQGGTSVKRASITQIDIKDSYTPTGTVTSSWDASAAKDGSVMCYVEGTKLTIAGNGSGCIYANADSSYVFSVESGTAFTSLVSINNAHLLNMSNATTMNRMFKLAGKLTTIDVSSWDVSNVTNMNATFDRVGLTTINFENWNVSNVTNMSAMFQCCQKLTHIDLSKWNVSKVTNMYQMFQGHSSIGPTALVTIGDVSNWNTSKVTDMRLMFNWCKSLTSLDCDNWDVSNVIDMTGMFQQCESLTRVNCGKWNTSSCTNMMGVFISCSSLTTIDVSKWNVSKVTNMQQMFDGCSSLPTLDVSNWNTSSCTNMHQMFGECSSLTTLDVSNWNVSKVTNMSNAFGLCSSLATLDVSNWNVGNVTNMLGMFLGCVSLIALDVSKWDVSKVTTMKNMFSCDNDYGNTPMVISELDVSRWNPASCTDMSFMFYGCKAPKEIDVSNWDVSKVQNFDHMFAHSYLKVNGTRNWKTTSATNMNALFHSVSNTVIDVTNFDTKNVQFFSQMFQSAGSLTKIIGLERFNTANGLGFEEMFQSCPNLRELNLSSFDTRKAKDGVTASTNGHTTATMSNFFQNNHRLEKVTFGANFSFNGDGTTTNTAHYAALHAPTTTYIPNADGKWYTQKRVPYTPAEVKTNGAETYYASLDLANDIDFLIKNKTLMDIGDAIRERVVDEVYYSPTQIPEIILNNTAVSITFENYSVTDDGNGNITISKGV